MKGKLSDICGVISVSFDFELSETPKAMILRLLDSQPKETMTDFFNNKYLYEEAKTVGFDFFFDIDNSSIGLITEGEVTLLVWEQSLQLQISETSKNITSKCQEVLFIMNISLIA